MSEIRIDPLTGQRAIVAAERTARPGGGLVVAPAPALDAAEDPFAAGNEDQTPTELFALRAGGGAPDTPGWQVRVVPNRYPALSPDSPEPPPHANRDLFWAGPARGAHEVIVNAPDPVTSLSALTVDQVVVAVDVWRERMRAHAGAACVHVSVNERAEAGSTVAHTHAQLYALEFVPAAIARERERFSGYATRTMGANLLAELVQYEVRQRERIVAIDDEAVLISPYGARMPYQLMIAPRTPRMRFEDDGPTGAALLHDALGRLARRFGASPPLNLWVRTAPRGAEHFCWRIDILPALTQPAGLELGVGLGVNVVAPELAAAELRDAS
ncbi:MAG: galactose-1-phosphate uridylyltransferase [Solirubrobacteraceae bacterium]